MMRLPSPSASRLLRQAAFALWAACAAAHAPAEPLQPASDAEVVETLPSAGRARAEERALRQRWVAQPGDPVVAVALSKRYLDQARAEGDPRFAGRALAVLQHWPQLDTAPPEVVLMAATLQQYLHDFDGAARVLEGLVKREPRHAQGWLTLATIRRVQGRYEPSDAACQSLGATGATFYGKACLAENNSLKGRFDEARQQLTELLATPDLPASTRAWLLTTRAELETRAGRRSQAEAAYRAVLAAQADEYARLSFADFLLDNKRPAEVLSLLKADPRSDTVLLRLAIAGTLVPSRAAQRDIDELRARMAQAALRPVLPDHACPRTGDVRAAGRRPARSGARTGAEKRRTAARTHRHAAACAHRARGQAARGAGPGPPDQPGHGPEG